MNDGFSPVGKFCILRSRDQGVVCGIVLQIVPAPGSLATAVVDEARQIHQWTQDNKIYTLFELANHGANSARISEQLNAPFIMFGVCGCLPCTPEAEENLRQSRWNQPYNPSASAPGRKKRRG